jgi:hypothetical protein
MSVLISTVKKIIPFSFRRWLKKKYTTFQFTFQLKLAPRHQKIALKKVQKKTSITVLFFLIHESVWKYEELYNLMVKDRRFNPVVIICPYIGHGLETMFREMNQAYNSFKNKNYNVIKSFDEKKGKWLNVKKEINPDIVFFTNPWSITKPDYLIQNYSKLLTCYVPYGFKNSYLYQDQFNKPMHNLVWKFYLETEIHKKLSLKYSRNQSINTVVTGAPGMDKLLQKNYKPVDVWKIKDKNIKRIIWAPHHSIPGKGANLDYSTFLKYSNFMFRLTEKYKNHIQIAFKPHPLLRSKLSMQDVWGKEKTDEYYNKWAELVNGQLNEGEYVDLFSTSDGMMHDSASFIVEYLYTNNPVMFLANDDNVSDRLNEIGKTALSKFYIAKKQEDIIQFIENVIIKENDIMKTERTHFFNSVVKPPNNITASENIFNDLKQEIFG